MRQRPVLLTLSLLLLVPACGSGSKNVGSEVTSKEAVAAVTSFEPADLSASIARLDEASFGNASLVQSLEPYLSASDSTRRWSAVYLAALLVDEKTSATLTPVLHDRNPINRAVAAGALSRVGVVEALPVLIDALGSNALLPYNDPPKPVAELAREALAASTGKKFSTRADWKEWWESVKAKLRWNGKSYAAP